jgi:hypothetical protein
MVSATLAAAYQMGNGYFAASCAAVAATSGPDQPASALLPGLILCY